MKQVRKIYDKVFKEKVVQLSCERTNLTELAGELGITATQLSIWRNEFEEFGEGIFSGKEKLIVTSEQEKMHKLEKRLKDDELEHDILIKAFGIFSKSGRGFIVSLKAMNNYSGLKKCAKFYK